MLIRGVAIVLFAFRWRRMVHDDVPVVEQGAFLVGMFSLMGALLGRPLPAILDGLPLASDVKEALLGTPNESRECYFLIGK